MIQVPLVNLKDQFHKLQDEIKLKLDDIFTNTAFIGGKHVKHFEEEFARYAHSAHAIGTANGTDALLVAYQAAGLERGDEVLVPSHTFIATASPLYHLGIRPVFVDIDPETYLMDVNKAEAAITSKTKAIVPVHLYGQAAPMDRFAALAQEHDLALIEDCAQAHGSRWNGQAVGTWGEMGCFSFYPGKNLGAAGDAGAVITSDKALDKRLRLLVNHGSESKYVHSVLGLNSRLDALQAAILSIKLKYIEVWTENRRQKAAQYQKILSSIPGLVLPKADKHSHHVYHLYVVRVPADRDRILAALHANGVGAGIHYPIPLHLQPVFSELGHKKGDFPVTEAVAESIISLPLCPELTQVQMKYIAEQVKETLLVAG
jgi:dTDP-4-amino-4,6-dideoxygalactose transaminase